MAAQKLAKLRQDDGAALYDLTEEQQEVAELLTQNKGPLNEAALRSIFREIFGERGTLVKPIRVAYLGPNTASAIWRRSTGLAMGPT